jgi:cytochrome P450
LLVAGFDSTKGLIVTGMLGLLSDQDQLQTLRDDPARIPLAVEEFLRHTPPFPRLQERYALADVELGGVTIPQGHPVVVDLTAANRDPDRFAHPETMDITDVDRGHLAFGPGIHHCLGAALARLEAEVAVHTLLARLPEISLACDPAELDWPPGVLSCPSTLPVTITAHSPEPPR